MKVSLTVYKDILVIETLNPEETDYPGWLPIGGTRIGCTINNTKTGLGVSQQALDWLMKVPKSHDDIGDVMWRETRNDQRAFSWLGGLYAIKSRECEGDNLFSVHPDHCIIIPNDIPIDAKETIDRKEKNKK